MLVHEPSLTIVRNLGLVSGNIVGMRFVGGIIGWNNGTVENCFSTGVVSGTGTGNDDGSSIGGVVGTNFLTDGLPGGIRISGTMKNCYATGDVSGSSNGIGGVVGVNSEGGIVQNCYATGAVSCS